MAGRDWCVKPSKPIFTVLIEIAWGKQRIMEVYLNVVEWARHLRTEAAARHYFTGRPAAALTVGEAVPLAAVLPDPLNWSPLRLTHAAILSNLPAVSLTPSPPCSRENRPGLGLR